jgi:predicted phage terminase large subunit-like protein
LTEESKILHLARLDLAAFCIAMRPDFQLPDFLEVLIDRLEAVERGDLRRLLVSCPPRHGKSLSGSVLFPAWYLGRNPGRFAIVACHSEELAVTFGRSVRNLVAFPLFTAIFPECRLASDSAAVHRFNTEAGGGFYAVGRGSALTGRGASVLILDDLVKDRAEADSEAVRKVTESWFREVAMTRLEPRGAIVAIGTRWHEADILGTLAADRVEPWETLAFPAIAELEDPLGREEGAPLWPDRFSGDELARIRAEIGSRAWTALYQGRPTPAEGSIFRAEWFQRFSLPPQDFSRLIISLDCAFKGNAGSDYSAATVWAETGNGYFLLYAVRGRWEFPDLVRIIVALAEQWQPHAVLIEDAASGQSAIQTLQRETSLPVLAVKPLGGKVERAVAVSPVVESGRVFLPQAAGWVTDFLEEVLRFPAGAHDDFVDSMTQALEYLRHAAVFHDPKVWLAMVEQGQDPNYWRRLEEGSRAREEKEWRESLLLPISAYRFPDDEK